MTRKIKRRKRQTQQSGRPTNWYLIGGVLGIGVIGLFALLFVSLQNEGGTTQSETEDSLVADYCASNEENCVAEGADNALITIVEVSDYGCGHCRNFNLEKADALRKQYVDSGQVKWVVMPYALRGQVGQYPTMPSAVSALCANEQGYFREYHKALFASQGDPAFNTPESFLAIASEMGMDVEAFGSCLANNNYTDVVLRNIDMANSAGVNSTPTFFINGRRVAGNLPNISDFQQIIDAELDS